MARYLALRLLDAIPTVFLVLLLVFIAMRILPGDPAIAALGDMATTEQLQIFRERMGLNAPLWRQFIDFVIGVLTLDFGRSMMSNQSVLSLIAANLPYTIELTIVAMIMGIAAGVPLGVLAATHRNKMPDSGVRLFSLLGYAVPDFYLGALLLITFSLNLRWFPISGGGAGLVDGLYHVFLPALTLALVKAAFIGRLTRTSLLEVLGKDYVRTARAKGARETRVIYRHGLRNALLPLTTGMGLSLLATLSGSVAIELVFNRPGIGKLLISAIAERDYAVIQGGVVVFAMLVVLINLLMDLVYIVVDPRVRGEVMSTIVEPIRAPDAPRLAIVKRIVFGRPATIFAFSIVAVFVLVGAMAPLLAPYDPLKQSIASINRLPSWQHWLGTDQFGRDVLSRMIYGSRNSLLFGLISPFLAAIFGTTLGVVAGYFGGIADRVISRVIDLLLAFPELLLAIMIAAVLGGGFWNIVAVITVAFIPGFARVARASTLAVRQEPFVEAAVAVGVSTPVIIFRHIVPNIAAPIVVLMTLWVASAIRLEASLSFLGIGTQPPNPSWGNIIRDGLNNLFGSPWPIIGAGFAITCVVLAFNLVGDAVRDVLDPDTSQ